MPGSSKNNDEYCLGQAQALRAVGLRATPARIAVLSVLRKSHASISHQDLVDQLAGQGWDRATLYRNLMTLVGAGLARRRDLGDHTWRFEAVERGTGSHEHPHFLCTECGEIECVPDVKISIPQTAEAPRAVREQSIEVHLKGLCNDCQ